jgi:hypothetical protein
VLLCATSSGALSTLAGMGIFHALTQYIQWIAEKLKPRRR